MLFKHGVITTWKVVILSMYCLESTYFCSDSTFAEIMYLGLGKLKIILTVLVPFEVRQSLIICVSITKRKVTSCMFIVYTGGLSAQFFYKQ